MRIAAAQIRASADPMANLHQVESRVKSAAEAGASLVVFPEATMCRFGGDLASVAERFDGPFATGIRKATQRYRVTAVVGMFTPADGGRVHNTLLVTGPGGENCYHKIHLYDAFGSRESDTVAPGQEYVTFELDGTNVGVATCYDLRFADQFSALRRAGVSLVAIPASWGEGPGKAEQWELLVRARALDSQAWVVACDQAWTMPDGSTPLGLGHSLVVDPFGHIRGQLGNEAGMLISDIDSAMSHQARQRIPLDATGMLPER